MGNDWNNRRMNTGAGNSGGGGKRTSENSRSENYRGSEQEDRGFERDMERYDQREMGRGLRDPRDGQFGAAYGNQYSGNAPGGFSGGYAADYSGSSSEGSFGGRGADYGSASNMGGRSMSRGRGRDISDFSLGIDRGGPNDRSQGDWFQSPYQGYSATSGQRNEGWGAGSRGFSQNPNYASYSAGLEGNRTSYAGLGPKGYRRSDERIKEDIGHELERHPDIDASQIEITLADGIVTLKGHVEDRSQKRMAEHSIEGIPGVKDIRNELVIDRSLFDRARDFFMGRSGGRNEDERDGDQDSARGSYDDSADFDTAGAKQMASAKNARGSKAKRDARKRPM